MKKILLMTACAALTMMVSCSDEDSDNTPQKKVAKEREDIVLSKTGMAVNHAVQDFDVDLFKNLCKENEGNVFMSPFSAHVALSVCANGANGATYDEMIETLVGKESGLDVNALNDYNRVMSDAFVSLDNTTNIVIANGVWGKEDLKFESEFNRICSELYGAKVETADFKTGEAQNRISEWCSLKTNGMIQNAGKDLTAQTVAAIVNSIYFNGAWTIKFDKEQTRSGEFTCADGKTKTVDMMRLYDKQFMCCSTEEYDVLCMPYGNEAFNMLILLPNRDYSLDEILAKSDGGIWCLDGMGARQFDVQMPRFELEGKYKLDDCVQEMGIKAAFTGDADFTKMSTNKGLAINTIYQLSKIKVDEEGTEAAAVTVIGFYETSVPDKVETRNFFVDHPFAFAIVEKSTNAILFMGKVTDLGK